MSDSLSGSRELEPDAIGPWAVVLIEHVRGVEGRFVTAYGPMPRDAAEELLDWLDVGEPWTKPAVPESARIDHGPVQTGIVVEFGRTAIRLMLEADQINNVDQDERWRRADAELAGR
jgi:hypothetical protein